MTAQTRHASRPRIDALDMARGAALVAMAVYHFTWDLEFFGYVEPGLTAVGGWKLFARCIAASFLFLAGVSLFLAHGDGIRWPGFLRRLAMVGGAALAISVATYVAMPDAFIFFGILHQIALAGVLGLAFLRLPAALTLIVAAAIFAAPFYLRAAPFDHPALWWVGLSTHSLRSNDYVPLFPWFAAVLAGIATARLAVSSGVAVRLATWRPAGWSRPLIFGGRHSLAVYLIHQPVLIGCVWLAAQIFPPEPIPRAVSFRVSCERSCQQTRDTAFCARYCACMLETLERDAKLEALFEPTPNPDLSAYVQETASICTMTTDDATIDETAP
jgi:uncharacterized membrane protein